MREAPGVRAFSGCRRPVSNDRIGTCILCHKKHYAKCGIKTKIKDVFSVKHSRYHYSSEQQDGSRYACIKRSKRSPFSLSENEIFRYFSGNCWNVIDFAMLIFDFYLRCDCNISHHCIQHFFFLLCPGQMHENLKYEPKFTEIFFRGLLFLG